MDLIAARSVTWAARLDKFFEAREDQSMTLSREVRSWRRPPRITVAPPGLGSIAPVIACGVRAEPFMAVFLRHLGCPFAEVTVRQLALWRRRLPALRVVAVSQGDREATGRWLRRVDAASVSWIADPAGEIYAAWGVGTTNAAHFLGRGSLGGVVRLWARGIRHGASFGSRWQSAATFVVDRRRRVVWRHLPDHAADFPDFIAAYQMLESSGS